MSIVDFLSDLRRAGIQLSLNEDKLKIKAPSGALTNEIKVELKNRKEEIIEFLRESTKEADTSTIPLMDRNEPVPLSFSQQGLWFIDQMYPGSVAYNMPFAVKLMGQINVAALNQAIQEILTRHESLRSYFEQTEEGVPHVAFSAADSYEITQESKTLEGDLKSGLLTLAGEEAMTPFKLSEGPLFRFKLIKIDHPDEQDLHLLLGSIHHIISDGWSMSVLMREIAVLYAVYTQGAASPLPPLPIQYADFAAWQRDFLQGDTLEQQLGFWRSQLSGMPSLLALPTDRPRPSEQTSNGAKYEFNIDDALAKSLGVYCKDLSITLFTGLMAAWQLLLSKYAQQDKFCVGIPMAGRSRKETENLIGFFVNALMVKADLSNNPTVAEFVQRVKETVLGAFSHQDVPLQLILDDLNVPRSLAHQPLAQVGFQLQNFSGQGASDQEAAMIEQVAEATQLRMEPVTSDESASKYDMILTLVQNGDALSGNVEFNTDLFDKSTIAQMINHFERAIDRVVNQGDQPIQSVSIATDDEIREAIGVADDAGELLPLSSVQHELFLDSLVNPDSIQNMTGYWVNINTELDETRFEAAVDIAAKSAKILDARFYACDLPFASPGYQVFPNEPCSHFELVDYTDKGFNADSDAFVAERDAWLYSPRDIFNDALYIPRLYKLSKQEYVLAVSAHHLVSDGLSFTTHLERIVAAYESLLEGTECPEWHDNFADFISQDQLNLDQVDTIDYWRKALSNVEPMNFSLPPNADQSQNYQVIAEELSLEESNIIRNYCAEQSVHPSELFRCLTAYLVKACSRPENDFVLLEIQGGRSRTTYDQIGVYYRQVPFVVAADQLSADKSVTDFYQFSQSQQQAAKPFRTFSMERQRDMIGQGRLSFMFNFYNFMREVNFGDSKSLIQIVSPRPENVVQVVVRDLEQFHLSIMFETALFAEQGFISRLKRLALEVASGRATKLVELPLQSSEDAASIEQWNQTSRALPNNATNDFTIVDWFERQVEKTPDAVALVYGESSLTYAELNTQANQLAQTLIARGVNPQDRVAISLGRSLSMVVAVWGALKAGATYIPIDVNYPKERLAFLIEDSQAKCLITENCMQARLPDTNAIRILMDGDAEQIAEQPTSKPKVNITTDDLIYIIYTSGSTGKPKGAAVRHHGEVNLLSWYVNDFNMCSTDKALVISAFGFDLTQKNLFAMLVCGGTLVIPEMDQYDDAVVLKTIKEQGITLLNCAPSAFYPLVDFTSEEEGEQRSQELASLRYLFLGGEPIRLPALYEWLANGHTQCQLVNSYGPTECTDVVSYHVLDSIEPEQTLIPIGKPINNTQLYVLDDDLNALPVGLVGELCIAGDGVGAGYIGRDDLTQSAFVDNPFNMGDGATSSKLYKTGDLARFLEDGSLEYIGRKDFQIKLRGLRIELGEIEHALQQLNGVKDGLVLVKQDQLVAYVVTESEFEESSWRQLLADYLPDYMVPTHLVTLDQWPLTPNGKVDRKALPEPDQASRRVPYVAPRNDVERTIAQIWSVVLNVEEVGIYDNFFDLGGHSLLATQVASRARKAFNANIQLRDLLGEPTIASIAMQVEKLIRQGGAGDSQIVAVDREQRLPLSFAQQRLWLLDKIEPGSVAYNVPMAVRIEGDLNIKALEGAFNDLIARHEVLRTSFQQDEEGGYVAIADESTFGLPVTPLLLDADDNDPESIESEVKRLVAIEVMTPFQLETAPLMRAKLLRLTDSSYVLSVVLHHIITDGWSMGLLINELGAYYVNRTQVDAAPQALPELTLQYVDFAHWQRTEITDDVLEQHLGFWKDTLDGVSALNLPTDYARPNVQTYKGASVHFQLTKDVKAQFGAIAKQHNTTLFNILMAAYGAFLHRYTGQDDFAVGTPVAGRDNPDLENVVGFFVNTLVVRQQFEGVETFSDLLSTLSDAVLNAQAHQQIPFEQIVEAVDPTRDMSRSPIFQTMLVYQNLPVDQASMASTESQLGNIRFSPVGLEIESAKYELMLTVVEGSADDPFHCQLQFNTDLFATKTAENIANHFQRFCESLAQSPKAPLYELSLLDQSEIDKQVSTWNQTQVDYDRKITIHEMVARASSQYGDSIAVKCGQQFLTYSQLDQVANHIAKALMEQGVKADDKVGLCFNRNLGLMPSILGILKAGATYIPLDASYPEGRIRYIVEDAEIPLIVTTGAIAETLALDGIQLMAVDDLMTRKDDAIEAVNEFPNAERLLYMIYTSGSTGRPKGTGAFHRAEVNLLNWYNRDFNMTPQDRVMLMSAIGFDLTQKNLFAPLVAGATLIIPEFQEFDPGLLRSVIEQEQVTWINCAPSAFYPLQDDSDDWKTIASLKNLFLGGEPINLPRLQRWLEQTNCKLVNSYGPTECTDIAAWHVIDLEEEKQHAVLPIGRPNDNVRLYILGSHNELLPIGAVGELCIGGDSVGPGYLNNQELTQEVFIQNPLSKEKDIIYRTGDLARYRDNGLVEYLGRRDQQVKLRGFRIETGEIQGVINEFSGVVDSLVSVVKSEAADQLVVWVVCEQCPENGSDEESELIARLKQHAGHYLPVHMVPGAWRLLPEFPLTPNGKIDRKALPKHEFGEQGEIIEPRTDLEKSVAANWCGVLGLDRIGVDQNFFHLGGHSLLATKAVAKLAKEFDREIPVKLLFEAPTVELFAEKLFTLESQTSQKPPVKPCGLTEDIPLSLGQQRLWLFEQLNPGTAANNMPAAVKLKGKVNTAAIQRAVNELFRRHDSLRTVFYLNDAEQPRQRILPKVSNAVVVKDLSKAEDPLVQSMLAAEKDRSEPFDLLKGPLLRAGILKVAEESYVLTINMHHIISDGVSVSIMLRELMTLYYVFDKKLPSPLPELSLQYSDFAVWQQDHLKGDVLENQLSYWDEQLAQAPVLSTFPTDHPRPVVQTTNGKTKHFQFEPAFAKQLQRYCQQNGVTPFMFMFASWSLLLSRYARQEDLCIGIPTAGRHQPELDNIIGFFINSMVLRVDLSGNPSVAEHLDRVKSVVLDGFANGDVPVETIVERLSLERNPAFTPLVQVAFQLLVDQPAMDAGEVTQQFEDLDIELVETEGVTAKFDMLLTLNQGDDYLLGSLEYNTDLYNDETIDTLVHQYIAMAKGIMDDASHSVNHYPLYSNAELLDALKIDRHEVDDIMPLTSTQQAFLWNLQINPDTLQYSVGYSFEIRRAINEELFRQALQIVTDQFVALRTEFH
ncbi:MAG: amino acid adenylation domain-containing protein, partial [Pseudomonadales bacterium]|nr:amino acid adenylation domain-containing protein [Pseudomonadales bacterium]